MCGRVGQTAATTVGQTAGTTGWLVRVMALVMIGGASLAAPALAVAQSEVVELAIPGRQGANPSLAARGAQVALAWSAASTTGMDLYLAMSRDGGRTFGAPVQVNQAAGQARVSGEQPPRVALVPRANGAAGAVDVVVVWTVKQGNDWQLLTARSTDGGRTFGAAAPVPGSVASGARGWEAVDVDAQGRVSVLWLDHRDAANAPMTHAHGPDAPKPDPTERAKLSRLFYTTFDGKTTSTKDALSITNSVCYCCKTALVQSGGRTYAAWRQVYPGSLRDIAFTVSRDGGKRFAEPVKVSDDRWQIDGCPDNGPAMIVDASKPAAHTVHVVWPTGLVASGKTELALYYAASRDAKTFTPRVRVPTSGLPSHPVMALNGTTPLAVWDEVVDGQRRLAAARISPSGAFTPVTIPGSGGRWYPTVAQTTDGIVVAWVQQSASGTSIGVSKIRTSDR